MKTLTTIALSAAIASIPLAGTLAMPAVSHAEETSKEMNDAWLEAKIATTYSLNRNLSVFDIDTEVDKGVASLSGVVASDIQKELAAEIAKSVEGVKSVNNKLTVDASKEQAASSSTAKRSFGQMVEDMTTTATVKSKLLGSTSTPGLKINVDTMRGVVTLKGTVENAEQKELIEKIAGNTEGVANVDNKLDVRS